MLNRTTFLSLTLVTIVLAGPTRASAQQTLRMKSAVVALTDDRDLRVAFESGIVAQAEENDYDAITTFDIVANVNRIDDKPFLERMHDEGVQFILMLRPSSIGAGSSLDSVRSEVSPELFANMRDFARAVSTNGGDELVAVVHMAIYSLVSGEPELVSAGAVWLDEEVEDQAQGVARLIDLIAYNVNAVRPAIRRHVGLPVLN